LQTNKVIAYFLLSEYLEPSAAIIYSEVIRMALKKNEKLKLEIAKELGLYERVQKEGWKSLSAKETGRIGGMLSKRKKLG